MSERFWFEELDPVLEYNMTNASGERVTDEPLFFAGEPFTKSNGTIMARVYERLTRASRRRAVAVTGEYEDGYRKGTYDTLNAIRNELV